MMDPLKSNYSNLYDLLDEAETEVTREKEQIELEQERKRNRVKIEAAEAILYVVDANQSRKFLPDIEKYLELLSQALGVTTRSSRSSGSSLSSTSDVLDEGNSARFSPINPELDASDASIASTPPSAPCTEYDSDESDDGTWFKTDRRDVRRDELRDELKGDIHGLKEEIRQVERETRRDNRDLTSALLLPSLIRAPAPAPAPIIINNNNNNNTGVKEQREMREKRGKRAQERTEEARARAREAEAEKDEKRATDEMLTRILTGLAALGLGAWGIYELAKSSGKEVNNVEIDAAAEKARGVLKTLLKVNSVLSLSETYQNLDRCVSLWESYRSRIKSHQANLGFYKKLTWIPLAVSGASRALVPNLWRSSSGEMLTLGVGLVFGYGALRWLYARTYYSYAYTSKDEWDRGEMKKVLQTL